MVELLIKLGETMLIEFESICLISEKVALSAGSDLKVILRTW